MSVRRLQSQGRGTQHNGTQHNRTQHNGTQPGQTSLRKSPHTQTRQTSLELGVTTFMDVSAINSTDYLTFWRRNYFLNFSTPVYKT